MDEVLARFMELFNGRKDVWGGVEGVSIKEPVTIDHYRNHLEGKKSLGIYPLLDNGHVHFFAIDIDEKVWEKALSIRKELLDLGIHVYIAESKGKGYHVYGFADILAHDIRIVLNGVLARLSIKAEVFPKQDKLNEKLRYGNYINLPCFGLTRKFQSTSHVPLETGALSLIKKTDIAVILKARDLLAPPKSAPTPPQEKKSRDKSKKHPPCIEAILKGVAQGCRDEAAFALARHYLDQGYLVDEVTVLLEQWNLRNNPPIGDERQLKTKAESAAKGYAFGCKSIIDEPLLASLCPGEDRCVWRTEAIKDRKKRGLLRELSSYETPDFMYEQVVSPGDHKQSLFVSYNRRLGSVTTCKEIQDGEVTIKPIMCEEITEGAVRLPTGIEDYGNTIKLHAELMDHIVRYVDMAPKFLEFGAWYILMSWVYDRLPTLTYMRFDGDTGTGKSRSLDVVGDLCYKPMVLSGAITPAPIYRLIKKFRGTLVLDEADFAESDEKAEVTKILNCGFERGRPVIRCNKEDPDDLQVLPTFGPKVFATRFRFQDLALEARCLTYTMEETDRENIPPYLNSTYHDKVASLRNQLLLWRFRNHDKIDPNKADKIELDVPGRRKVEPRLKQTCIPFTMVFSELPETMDKFRNFITDYNDDLVRDRFESNQGRVVLAVFQVAERVGKNYITSGAVSKVCLDEMKLDLKPRKVASILKSLKLRTEKKRLGGKQGRFLDWNDTLLRKIHRRYIPNPEDFADLLTGEPDDRPEPEEDKEGKLL